MNTPKYEDYYRETKTAYRTAVRSQRAAMGKYRRHRALGNGNFTWTGEPAATLPPDKKDFKMPEHLKKKQG
jgi:hypothetical protein